MANKPLNPQSIASALVQNITDKDAVFVFSTDVVLNSWVDYLITHPDICKHSAVPMERFIAWDNFKGTYLKATREGLSAIPSILRKFFVHDFLAKNAAKPQEQRLKVIINSQDSIAKNSDSFAQWLSQNLSSLHYWKNNLDKNLADYGQLDDEDQDYLYLYQSYSSFLEANSLFEPAWIEETDFGGKNKKFFIFYPELLEDFRDYQEALEKSENVTIYTLPADLPSPKAFLYSDSRKELRQTILRIAELYNTGKADFSEIALSVPDMDTYRPYIEREFSQYQIPFVIKAGTPLLANSAGKIFREINDCHSSDFTYDSVRALLLDENIPWKDELSSIKEDLIREGNRMRIICSTDRDNWIRAFNSKIGRLEHSLDKTTDPAVKEEYQSQIDFYQSLKEFYSSIKGAVNAFFPAEKDSFENIQTSWIRFKEKFLKDDSNFGEEANLILGRCISELQEIIQIEKSYKDCQLEIPSPFGFFLKELESKKYQPQTDATGVTIYPYKLSAAAFFKYQFVIDASQTNLEVPYKRLTFLNSTKRKKLHLTEEDKQIRATEAFIKLYAKSSEDTDPDFVHFSAAENTFAGFAIPHSLLDAADEKSELLKSQIQALNKTDYILGEKKFFLGQSPSIAAMTQAQKDQLKTWKNNSLKEEKTIPINARLEQNIDWALMTKRKDKNEEENRFYITARGDLERFFPCPRKWLLSTALHLTEDSLDTKLMQNYDMGNLNHKIMELFMEQYMNRKLPFYDQISDQFMMQNEDNTLENTCMSDQIDLMVSQIVQNAIREPSEFRDATIVIQTLDLQKDKIKLATISFLKNLLVPYASKNNKKTGTIESFSGIGNCTVHSMEQTIKLQDPSLDFNYSGKIDLLLTTPDNAWIILDYKNSASSMPKKVQATVDEEEKLEDFQMALYTRLVTSTSKKDVAAGVFYAIKDGSSSVILDQFSTKEGMNLDSYLSTLNTLDQYGKIFNDKVKAKDFDPTTSDSTADRNNVKSYENCKNCPFKSICRTTYTIGGRQITYNGGTR